MDHAAQSLACWTRICFLNWKEVSLAGIWKGLQLVVIWNCQYCLWWAGTVTIFCLAINCSITKVQRQYIMPDSLPCPRRKKQSRNGTKIISFASCPVHSCEASSCIVWHIVNLQSIVWCTQSLQRLSCEVTIYNICFSLKQKSGLGKSKIRM